MKRRDFILGSAVATAASLSYSKLYAQITEEIENAVVPSHYDVIVLGVGSMGSATCHHLAKKGYKVLGLEQFDIPHALGSHSGQSRLIRKAYGEASDYVPLLQRAYDNWASFEAETGHQVYHETGVVYFAGQNNTFLNTVKESAAQFNIPLNKLTQAQCEEKYPQFNLPADFERLEEPGAGFLTPERIILLYVQQALMNKAVIRSQEKVLSWTRENGTITVTTNKRTYQAKKLVITAGPWAGKMIPDLAPKLTVTRQSLAWVQPKNWDNFALGKLPCWNVIHEGYDFYGFPVLPVGKFGGPLGLKLALHYPGGEVTDPDRVNRNNKASDEKVLVEFLNAFMPDGYRSTLEMKTCLYTNTPDENFIVDYLPGFDKDVAVAAGFSGHGFKFVSVIGEVMSDLVTEGSTQIPIGFLNAQRFG